MTPDQIRQIAEEYREDIINQMGIPKDFISADVRTGLTSDCISILNWLSTRYCVVERSKVEKEYNELRNVTYSNDRLMAKYTAGRISELDILFGSETFNKKKMNDKKYTIADSIKLWESFLGGSTLAQYVSDELKLCSGDEELYRYRLNQIGLYVFFKHLHDICKSDNCALYQFKELISELNTVKDLIPDVCVKVVKNIIDDLNNRNICPDWLTYLENDETNKSDFRNT